MDKVTRRVLTLNLDFRLVCQKSFKLSPTFLSTDKTTSLLAHRKLRLFIRKPYNFICDTFLYLSELWNGYMLQYMDHRLGPEKELNEGDMQTKLDELFLDIIWK
jgi:hypothetical protein